MRIQFVSNYFPPEVNAPATRLDEHARQWVRDGHDVEVLTSVPNFPEGQVYDGYENRFTRETRHGIDVRRVPMYVSANEGIARRTLSYLSFMLSAIWYARQSPTPDVVVATSPQFFAAVAGWWIARQHGVPFVLEIRDLWPESIVAVGAMERNAMIRLLERVERFLYREADRIVVVTDAFKRSIAAKGIPGEKITVLKNGVDLDRWDEPLDQDKLDRMRREHDLSGKFVASYIGTIGMAHRADVLLEAALQCDEPDVVFLVVGAGAQRQALEERYDNVRAPNFRLLDKVPKDDVPYLLALSDVSVVHLRDSDLFKTVIPSKIFEAMATRTPIVLGVRGETRAIIDEAEAGVFVPPEDAEALADAVVRLKRNPDRHTELAQNAYEYVHAHFDRTDLAREYAALLSDVAAGASSDEPTPR
jgi:glycosyltransferase involved in cell wall biosynthesis